MLSQLLYILERGGKRLLANTKLLFLTVILFVFPLLFIVVLERFYMVAAVNVASAEQQKISTIHDVLMATVLNDPTQIQSVVTAIARRNDDITTLRVYETSTSETVTVLASNNPDEIASEEPLVVSLSTSRITPGETFSLPLTGPTGRVIEASRALSTGSSTELFLFSEHARGSFDTLLTQRKLDAYVLLSLLFVFMIALAYWISRQTDWQKQYDKLAATLKERDLFSNMIAHEFRTPLTAIKGYASFLQESKTMDPAEHKYADTIRESAERLVLLVNDFLEVARIQSGRMKIERKTIDVRDPLQTVVTSLTGKATEKGLHLVYTPALKPQHLNTDLNRFIQVITNIVSNSVKYTDAGTVEISCEEDRRGIIIRVKDTGMGISAADQQKLFAPFSRVGGVEETTTTGTGLGMWITKQLIELLGGTIAVESIKGVGTHIVMTFTRTKAK